ncbi:hypothetical protein FOL47_009526 [Perkinsus chesapeaki]|uniref:Uncharacterized protein n=1 Tax=Perkinsus chesapeaki TaxID=330153 RepID=A0A7J6MS79_PERCH|nr:hypothetical protein FOL47_009526 [Perkinsus chesapeaki]
MTGHTWVSVTLTSGSLNQFHTDCSSLSRMTNIALLALLVGVLPECYAEDILRGYVLRVADGEWQIMVAFEPYSDRVYISANSPQHSINAFLPYEVDLDEGVPIEVHLLWDHPSASTTRASFLRSIGDAGINDPEITADDRIDTIYVSRDDFGNNVVNILALAPRLSRLPVVVSTTTDPLHTFSMAIIALFCAIHNSYQPHRSLIDESLLTDA